MNDQLYAEVKEFLLSEKLPRTYASTKGNFIATARQYKVNRKGNLKRDDKIVVKDSETELMWNDFHQHQGNNPTLNVNFSWFFMYLGREKCWQKINDRFYWQGGEKFVREMTKDCPVCAQKNDSHWPASVASLRSIKKTPLPMMEIHLDCIGSLGTVSDLGNKYIVIAVDAFTKYVEASGNDFPCFDPSL